MIPLCVGHEVSCAVYITCTRDEHGLGAESAGGARSRMCKSCVCVRFTGDCLVDPMRVRE